MCKFCENLSEIKSSDDDVSWWMTEGGFLWCETETPEGLICNCKQAYFCLLCGRKVKEPPQ